VSSWRSPSPPTAPKIRVGLWEGDTENKVVVTDLLADLVCRGLECEPE
jgi:hypothetical protein